MTRKSAIPVPRVLPLAVTALCAFAFAAMAAAADANPGLKQYVLPDHTASVMLPGTWKVTQTGVALIVAQGPNGELAMFGILVPAHDGSTTRITPQVLNQPYSADPKDKFTQSLAWVRTHNGKSPVQIQFLGATPIPKTPPAFGPCTSLTALVSAGGPGQLAVEADECSMPVDTSGNYQNFFKVVGVAASQANQERPALEAILGSYQLNPAALQKVQNGSAAPKTGAGAPAAAAAHGANGSGSGNGSALTWAQAIAQVNAMKQANAITQLQAGAINSATMNSMIGANNAANNMDMGVIRGDTPVYAVGQSQPLFWVGN
jgi:hypothetical protein